MIMESKLLDRSQIYPLESLFYQTSLSDSYLLYQSPYFIGVPFYYIS